MMIPFREVSLTPATLPKFQRRFDDWNIGVSSLIDKSRGLTSAMRFRHRSAQSLVKNPLAPKPIKHSEVLDQWVGIRIAIDLSAKFTVRRSSKR
jgi:hypothetical protein